MKRCTPNKIPVDLDKSFKRTATAINELLTPKYFLLSVLVSNVPCEEE